MNVVEGGGGVAGKKVIRKFFIFLQTRHFISKLAQILKKLLISKKISFKIFISGAIYKK